MWKPILFVAAALAVLFWVGHAKAQAPEAPQALMQLIPMPVPCTSDAELVLDRANKTGFVLTWQGILEDQVLYQLYLQPGGTWMITLERAGKPGLCVVGAGSQNELMGIGGI
jgi:hypothetical protein